MKFGQNIPYLTPYEGCFLRDKLYFLIVHIYMSAWDEKTGKFQSSVFIIADFLDLQRVGHLVLLPAGSISSFGSKKLSVRDSKGRLLGN